MQKIFSLVFSTIHEHIFDIQNDEEEGQKIFDKSKYSSHKKLCLQFKNLSNIDFVMQEYTTCSFFIFSCEILMQKRVEMSR
jgi:hypothetical protein